MFDILYIYTALHLRSARSAVCICSHLWACFVSECGVFVQASAAATARDTLFMIYVRGLDLGDHTEWVGSNFSLDFTAHVER